MSDPILFGPFRFDPTRRRLLRDGSEVELGQRAALLLERLIAAQNGVVSKAELMEAAWPGTAVEEGNLTVQIAGLRKLLGHDAEGRDWIVTVPRLGYRLVTASAAIQGPEAAERPTCAVLPFQTIATPDEASYFADGIVADIITALSRFRALAVLSRNATLPYRDRVSDMREVALALGARYILEGSVQRSDDRLRIHARLVDGDSAITLWTDRFDGDLADIFDVQDRITEAVATVVVPTIQASELALLRQRRPDSAGTYDIQLRARALLSSETEPDNAAAITLLDQALDRDPDNPTILAQAVWALEHRTTMGWPAHGPDDAARCIALARRALRLGTGDALVMAQCAGALVQTAKDYEAGMAVIGDALRINPNDLFVISLAGVLTMHCGDLDEAEAHFRQFLQLAPQDPDIRFSLTSLAMIAIIRGEHEAALGLAARSLAVNDRFDPTYWMLVAANAHLGRMEAARAHLARLQELVPGISLTRIRQGQPARYPDRIGAVLEGLRLAGLPD